MAIRRPHARKPILLAALASGALAVAAGPAGAVVNQLDFAAPIPGTVAETGFTTLLPGSDLDAARVVVGGGQLVVSTGPGDAFLGFNDQLNALGLPVVEGSSGYTVRTTLQIPPVANQPFQSAGLYVGKGEDDYVKSVLSVRDGGAVLNVVRESAGNAVLVQNSTVTLGTASQITIQLAVAADGTVRPTYTLSGGAPQTPTATKCIGPCVDAFPAPESRGGGVVAGVMATNFDDPATPGVAPTFSPRFSSYTLDNPNQTDPGLPQPPPGAGGTTTTPVAQAVCTPGAGGDTTPPTIVGRTPAASAKVAQSGPITVRFSEPIVAPNGAVRLTTGIGGILPSRARLSTDGRSVTVVPTESLPETGGVFFFVSGGSDRNAVTDAACNPLAATNRSAVDVRTPSGGKVTLSSGQLLVNQRISQAAIARETAIRNRLEALTGADIQSGSLGRSVFAPGVVLTGSDVGVLSPSAGGRPLVVPPLSRKGGTVDLSAAQLRINQRISQAAVRRVNSLQASLDAGLTGGDVADRSVPSSTLARQLGLASAGGTGPTGSSLQDPAAPKSGGGTVTLSESQLRINQRISQAAVRRLNVLRARLALGLTGRDFRDGSIGGNDLG